MSYDIAVWEGDEPSDDRAAEATFNDLYARFIQMGTQLPATPRIAAFIDALLEHWVDLTEEDHENQSPFATGPIRNEASGPMIYLPLSYSRCESVSASAATLAAEHQLVCFDPQQGRLRRPYLEG